MRRTQIYLDEQQAEQLAARARSRGATSSHVIREAIDRYLAEPEDDAERRLARFRAILDQTFGAIPRLADGAQYVDEIRGSDAERSRALDQRRA